MGFDWEPERKYLRGANNDIWRSLSLGWSTFAHERWDPERGIWHLALELADGLTEVTGEDAATVVGAALTDPGEGTRLVIGLPGADKLGDRGQWLCDRIGETLDHLGGNLPGAIHEVSMARVGTDDYAYEMDVLIEVKSAYPTLLALWRELRETQQARVQNRPRCRRPGPSPAA